MVMSHYYHVFAGGDWQRPFREHFTALEASGLMGLLDHIGVGIVGSDAAISDVRAVLPAGVGVVGLAQTGFEQLTLDMIPKAQGDVLLYAHTKGSFAVSERQDNWRRTMTWFNVMQHRTMLKALRTHDTAGIWWIPRSAHPRPHYQGNFWWANMEYLRKCRYPVSALSRWEAELWLGDAQPVPFDAYPGSEGECAPVADWITDVSVESSA
jgi:hypothetical protein